MIKFPCKCGYVFELPDDMAGGLIQCTRCGLLADVPGLNDLANLADDGTFLLEEYQPIKDPSTLADMHLAYTRGTNDARGNERDLRTTVEDLIELSPPSDSDEPQRVLPRYDPETGELIRPIELKEPEPLLAIPVINDPNTPVAALPVEPIVTQPKSISYANRDTQNQVTPGSLLLELLMPANAFVMLFVFIFYIATGAMGFMLAVGSSLYFHVHLQLLNLPLWLIFAHYGCVIEDTGPDSRDELPRPLRHLQWVEDIWNPFLGVFTAILLCYGPAIALLMFWERGGPLAPVGLMLLVLLGSFFLPAVLLASVTSGTLENLRPDRVLGVIRNCGGDYVLAVGVLTLVLLLSVTVLTFYPGAAPYLPFAAYQFSMSAYSKYAAMPIQAVCVYLTHYFCWLLGLIYRSHHEQFPWIMQFHRPVNFVRTPKTYVARTRQIPGRRGGK